MKRCSRTIFADRARVRKDDDRVRWELPQAWGAGGVKLR
jgi:hypothetical protein